MSNEQVLVYVEKWLKKRSIKSFFESKKEGKEKYIKMTEKDLYDFCYKLINLIENNID